MYTSWYKFETNNLLVLSTKQVNIASPPYTSFFLSPEETYSKNNWKMCVVPLEVIQLEAGETFTLWGFHIKS